MIYPTCRRTVLRTCLANHLHRYLKDPTRLA
jgi:hypothetical protein